MAGVARAGLGDGQQQAFHEVVSAAIDRVKTLGGDRQEFLEQVLIEHRGRLEAPRRLPDLAGAVHALVDSLDLEGDPMRWRRPGPRAVRARHP